MILLVLGLVGALLGIGGVSELHRAERGAANSLHAKFGPDSKVRVHFVPSGIASLHGDLAVVNVRARDFALDGLPWYVDPSAPHDGRIKELRIHLEHGQARGYDMDIFEAILPEIRYDFGSARHDGGLVISASQDGCFKIEFSEATLAADAMKKSPTLSVLKVTLEDGRMKIVGKAKSPFGTVSVVAEGRLVDRNGHELALDEPAVSINGKPVGPDSASSLVENLNPLLDLDKELGQPGMLQLQSVTTVKHRLVLSGVMRLPQKPAGSTLPPGINPPLREGREGDLLLPRLNPSGGIQETPVHASSSLEFAPLNPPSRGEEFTRSQGQTRYPREVTT